MVNHQTEQEGISQLPFYDQGRPEKWKKILGLIFSKGVLPAINEKTEKNLSLRKMVHGKVLDLGSGRGAMGEFLKEINPKINLTGVDVDSYPWSSIRENYEQNLVLPGGALEGIERFAEEERNFDFVVSFGLPPWAIEDIIEHTNIFDKILAEHGKALFVFDLPLGDGFIEIAERMNWVFIDNSEGCGYPAANFILFKDKI